jgi:integrase
MRAGAKIEPLDLYDVLAFFEPRPPAPTRAITVHHRSIKIGPQHVNKPLKPLTDTSVRAVQPPTNGVIDIADVRSPGLFLRVTAAGAKSWTHRFTDPVSGQRARQTFARYPDLSLAEARKRAEELRKIIAKGINPVEHKRLERAEASTKTFEALADRYLKEHARRFKRTADADERNLRLHVMPLWGKRWYAGISRADVIALVEKLIAEDKHSLANKVQALISKVFAFAVDAALVEANPATRLKKRGRETAHTRTLNDAEIRVFWSRITSPPVSQVTGLALKLALLTGMRAGEVAGIHRSEIKDLDDPENAAILLPGARVKNRRTHFLPLSPMAREVLIKALALAGESDFAFPARHRDDASVDPHSFATAMRRFADDLSDGAPGVESWKAHPPTAHDLRRTIATRLSEAGVPAEDIEAVLNHARAGVTVKHYDQYSRGKEKRAALNLWALTLANIVDGGQRATVLPMRRRP